MNSGATGTFTFVDGFDGSMQIETLTFRNGTVDFGENTFNIGQPGNISVDTLDWTGGLLTGDLVDPSSGALTMTGGALAIKTLDGALTQNGGVIEPQDPAADTTIDGNYFVATAGTVQLDLLGTGEDQYDQLIVNGFVDLDADEGGGAALDIVLDPNIFCPTIGDDFVIVENDGVDFVSGTFKDKPNGGEFDVACGDDVVTFAISYLGGDGNDVGLTVTDVQPVPAVTAQGDEQKLAFGSVETASRSEMIVFDAPPPQDSAETAPIEDVIALAEDMPPPDMPPPLLENPLEADALLL